jgi:hypothetical protein
MSIQLEIVVIHRLPGRVRLRLSHSPKLADRMVDRIQTHSGIESIKYTAETENLLILFDQEVITPQELLLRAGLSLSREFDMSPVRIQIQKTNQSLISQS